MKFVIDTNVPIVANGQADGSGGRSPSIACQDATIDFLIEVLSTGTIVLDDEGEIQSEYRRHLSPRGQPGVGDRFYLEIINSNPRIIERASLKRNADGEPAVFPTSVAPAFDPSDRKFAALGIQENANVVVSTDSDWSIHEADLRAAGVRIEFLCGSNPLDWFI